MLRYKTTEGLDAVVMGLGGSPIVSLDHTMVGYLLVEGAFIPMMWDSRDGESQCGRYVLDLEHFEVVETL